MHDEAPTATPKHPNEASAFDRLVDANLELAAACREVTAAAREQTASVEELAAAVRELVAVLTSPPAAPAGKG